VGAASDAELGDESVGAVAGAGSGVGVDGGGVSAGGVIGGGTGVSLAGGASVLSLDESEAS
jgi:hypothetical protein